MNLRKLLIVAACGILTLLVGSATRAEDGHEGWLRYAPLDAAAAKTYATLPHAVRLEGDSLVLRSAREELARGLHGMLGITLTAPGSNSPAIILATNKNLSPESFRIHWSAAGNKSSLLIT